MNHLDGRDELSFWTDGSKLENNRTGTGVVWKMEDNTWHTRKVYLGKNKEVIDAELYGIDQALEIALRAGRPRARPTSQATRQYLAQIQKINVWSDSKSAIMRIEHVRPGPGQWLARRIHENAKKLQELGISVNVRWAPGHTNIEGNEKADEVAKQAARNGRQCVERFASLAYVARLITERKWKESRIWFKKQHERRGPEGRETYELHQQNNSLNRIAANSRKTLAQTYYQLKSGHAVIGVYLYRIKKIEKDTCNYCSGTYRQTVRHLLLDCRKWRRERSDMWNVTRADGSRLRRGLARTKEMFGDVNATRGIMKFIQDTGIGWKLDHVDDENRELERRLNLGIEDLDRVEEEVIPGESVTEV